MSLDISKVWLGTRDSYANLARLNVAMQDGTLMKVQMENPAIDPQAFVGDDDEEENQWRMGRRLVEVVDNVAILHISGSLVAGYAWYNAWYDLVSYQEIRDAFELIAELQSVGVNKVVMEITSGGGSVQGLDDLSTFIRQFDSNVLPVYAHVTDYAYSAGFWLASSARELSVNKMASVGSIGVIVTLVNYKGYYDEKGIEYTYLRSGKFKALGQSGEELTEEAKEHFMETVETLHGFFEAHVVANMSNSASTRTKWNTGKTFFAKDAINLGLADKITSYDTVVAKLLESSNNTVTFGENNSLSLKEAIMKFKFTAEQKAKLASGIALEDLGLSEEDLAKAKAALSENSDSNTDAEEGGDGSPVEGEGDESSEDGGEGSEEEVEGGETEASDTISTLYKASLATNTDLTRTLARTEIKLEDADKALKEAQEKNKALLSAQSELIKVASEATNRINVALNKANTDFSKLSAEDVIEAYTSAKEDFDKTFSGGQHSKQNVDSRDGQASLETPKHPINQVED